MRYVIFLLTFILINSCTSQSGKYFLSEALSVKTTDKKGVNHRICNTASNYIPDPENLYHTPERVVKINFHFMCNSEGKGNFEEKEGIEYVKTVLYAANDNMLKNKQMLLPAGNSTATMPTRYKYVLTPDPDIPDDDGIYFHQDDDFYFILNKGKNRNNYDREIFDKYGIQKGEVLNVFVQDNHLDSLKSPTYKSNMNGIAFDTWVKCSMWYSNMQEVSMKNGKPFYPKKWLAHKQMNHEIGHVFGLRHTWAGNDGCDDTPNHPNCWDRTETPPCNEFSNNVMDYNPLRNAWTPCQIGRAHFYLTQKENKRNLLVRTWCTKRAGLMKIKKDTEWNCCKDLEKDVVIESGATLTIRCRISLPKGAKIMVKPGAKLVLAGGRLHNDCGDKWQGIEIWKEGKSKGEVELFDEASIEDTVHEVKVLMSKE